VEGGLYDNFGEVGTKLDEPALLMCPAPTADRWAELCTVADGIVFERDFDTFPLVCLRFRFSKLDDDFPWLEDVEGCNCNRGTCVSIMAIKSTS
jgi:hypothetical protein